MISDRETALVTAAQSGDVRAQDELVADYLPLVYNIVGRALNGHADVDDVVQESMLRMLDGLSGLRDPAGFRSWLVAITMNQIRRRWRENQSAATRGGLQDAYDVADPGADFVDLTVLQLGLTGQRQETAEATRWLEDDDRALLSLWWLEAAGVLTRAEVANALELSPQHTAVRVQRVKAQLETARVVVRALAAVPRCSQLEPLVAQWDGNPSALWRKRIARHVRECPACSGHLTGMIPAEGLLAGLALVPLAASLAYLAAPGAARAATAAAATTTMPTVTTPTDPIANAIPAADVTPATTPAASRPAGHAARPGSRSRSSSPSHSRRRPRGRRRTAGIAATAATLTAVVGGGIYLTTTPSQSDESTRTTAAEARSATTQNNALTSHPTPSKSPTPHKPKPKKPKPKPTKAKPKPKPTKSHPRPTPKPTHTTTPTTPPPADTSTSTPAQQVISLVNTERAKAGCSPLTSNPRLTAAAQGHSRDMAVRHFFDHTNPDGAGPGERITAAGYQWSTYGENIAYGQQSPADVMKSWMNSPGHRANILNCAFKEIGIGIHNAPGGPWWTQNFGTTR
ncbi:sigma-70 family RNA polymerase sigma factor [Streptomyces sp. MST-110588]|uniref:sigma-70 family RNA polymerase sigma factor n=1 Tax=Streptomyces sp. MST-110588 TaxID=2833628 RepID=UPI001F5D91A4|nr:sigma-70 family RNA polymerase sigma factor [Streptomyces sp. MST-110588]UNO39940.1 sigma-70 family RNA polymerase sigma factor [Streptomyces sp. MST-110588]